MLVAPTRRAGLRRHVAEPFMFCDPSRPNHRETRQKGGFLSGSPDQIRTGVTGLRGRRPRPLDDGAVVHPVRVARGEGLEPSMTGPEPAVLPITPPPNGRVCPRADGIIPHVTTIPEAGSGSSREGQEFLELLDRHDSGQSLNDPVV